MSEKTTYEQILAEKGKLIYTTVGRSMRPFIRSQEDLVVVEKKEAGQYRKYDAVLYRRDTGKYVLHRIVKVRPDSYVMCGDNCWQLEYGITDRHILGVLTQVLRKDTVLDVNSDSYRRKIRLWCGLYPVRAVVLYIRELYYGLCRRLKALFH